MEDLFLSLGYDQVRANIHKSGREIDIEATHRRENRRAIAECKAEAEKVGGSAINKFVGALDAERRKSSSRDIVGYFISLSGFTETAVEQEKELGNGRIVRLNGCEVIEELVKGHVIVSPKLAMERAGRCVGCCNSKLIVEEQCELLAHEKGWIWVVYFGQGKQRTHFALIHADGEVIAATLTQYIIDGDAAIGGSLQTLNCLSYSEQNGGVIGIQNVRDKYQEYIRSEFGEIQLEGLPADQEVGTRRLNLENIFVPLHLSPVKEAESDPALPADQQSNKEQERTLVGEILKTTSRLAILASPGGGKSTLLKRLAIAYAFPERRPLVNDQLPDRKWLPLVIRCRQLGDLARAPIGNTIAALASKAEMGEHSKTFLAMVTEGLQNGEALLLVDGLDEIADEGLRLTFLHQLRTFLARYPTANIVVTSRVAGFRIIGVHSARIVSITAWRSLMTRTLFVSHYRGIKR